MKEPEHDRDDQESVKEQWGQNHNEAEAEADVCSDRMKWRRIKGDLCVGIVKRGTGKRQRQEGMLLSSSFTGIASSEDFLPGR